MIHPRNQTGSIVTIIIIVAVAAVAGLLGFLYWQSVNKEDSNTNTTENASVDPYAGWETYESLEGQYTIKFPADWVALKETADEGMYIRNFDPTDDQLEGGYPEGYINIRVLYDDNGENFKNMTGGYTIEDWYEALGKKELQKGAVTYAVADVKDITVAGIPAKSAKSVFTETDEDVFMYRGERLYQINLYPYGASSDPTVKKILDSFRLIHSE